MWKILIVVAILMHLGDAQRSSYAARPGSRSKLLPRFRKNETETTLDSRGGEESNFSTTTLSPELQGTLEDNEFVHRVSQWPKARQPFWYKNRLAISSLRHRETDGGDVISPAFDNNQRPRPSFQSPFQGPNRRKDVGLDISSSMIKGGNGDDSFAPEDFYNTFEKNPFLLYMYKLHKR